MAKIGTAHVEIKPVLNEKTLEDLTTRIEDAVAQAVERGQAHRDFFTEVSTDLARTAEAQSVLVVAMVNGAPHIYGTDPHPEDGGLAILTSAIGALVARDA